MSGVGENPENEQAMYPHGLADDETWDMVEQPLISDVDEYFTELAIDALLIVHNHLYLMEQSIRREIKQQTGHEPERFSLSAFKPETDQQMEHEIGPDDHFVGEMIDQLLGSEIEPERRMSQQIPHEIEPECVAQLQICYDYWQQCCMLRLVCSGISSWAQAVRAGYIDEKFRTDMDEKIRTDIAARAVIRLRKIKNRARLAGETLDVDKQRPLKIQRTEPAIHPISKAFHELVKGMDAVSLDNLHKKRVDELLFDEPKRKVRVFSHFCSFHLAGFNLDEPSIAPLGPPYQPNPLPPGTGLTKYVDAKTNAHHYLASSSVDVISIRVVKVGPDYSHPVEVYGKVIARDEIDYKCVYLFNCEREDAQTIKSEKDMLALTGPNRALVTLGYIYFEFDLKIKGRGGPDDDVPLSKGVVPYYLNPNHKRIKLQLASFHSTVKLVLQHVDFPVAASLQVSVVNQEPSNPFVQFDGKITAGTSRNYRHHMLLYDSSVCRGGLLSETGSLLLNRNLVAVNGYVEDPALVEDEKLVLYVCFLDANCDIEDKDKMVYEEYDDDEDDDEDVDEDDEDVDEDVDEADEEKEEDPKNVVTLKYPQTETAGEHGCHKLKVKVKWTAVLDKPEHDDFFHRYWRLPVGFEPNYRNGGFFE